MEQSCYCDESSFDNVEEIDSETPRTSTLTQSEERFSVSSAPALEDVDESTGRAAAATPVDFDCSSRSSRRSSIDQRNWKRDSTTICSRCRFATSATVLVSADLFGNVASIDRDSRTSNALIFFLDALGVNAHKRFVVKEFSVIRESSASVVHYVFKPPFKWQNSLKCHASFWSDGDLEYRHLRHVLKKALVGENVDNGQKIHIYVTNKVIAEWLGAFASFVFPCNPNVAVIAASRKRFFASTSIHRKASLHNGARQRLSLRNALKLERWWTNRRRTSTTSTQQS